MILIETIGSILGRPPLPAELQEIHRLQNTLKLQDNDPLLVFIVTLQAHATLLNTAPEKLTDALHQFSKLAISLTESETQKLAAKTTSEIAKAVSAASQKVAKDVASESRWKWSLVSAVGLTICFLTIGLTAFSTGQRTGMQAGLIEARNEIARADWANTTEGKAAYELHVSGDLARIINCNATGWQMHPKNKDICIPYAAKDGLITGWMVPTIE